MREIKFRAWENQNDDGWQMNYSVRVYCEPGFTLNGLLKDTSDQKFQQFTGLLDKNGKEIYEGDIVRATPIPNSFDTDLPSFENGEVVFGFATFGLTDSRFKNLEFERSAYFLSPYRGHIEVIGNIYENKDLLK